MYPPDDHILRDLGIVSHRVSAHRALSAAVLDAHKLDRSGRPAIGFLSALVDINCAPIALLAADPRWTATVALALHATGAIARGSVVAEAQLVRAGSNLIVVRSSVLDGGDDDPDRALDVALDLGSPSDRPDRSGALVASALLTFARIPAEASAMSATFDRSAAPTRTRMEALVPSRDVPLADRLGLRVTAPGAVEIDPAPYVGNSFGTVTGGVYGMLFQAAGESLDRALLATDVEVHYLSQTKSGPVVTRAVVVRDDERHVVCDVSSSVGDKVLTIGSVTLARR